MSRAVRKGGLGHFKQSSHNYGRMKKYGMTKKYVISINWLYPKVEWSLQ